MASVDEARSLQPHWNDSPSYLMGCEMQKHHVAVAGGVAAVDALDEAGEGVM